MPNDTLIFDRPPNTWLEGLPLGNGFEGDLTWAC